MIPDLPCELVIECSYKKGGIFMSNPYETLFTPFQIGNCEIRNRIVIPAM